MSDSNSEPQVDHGSFPSGLVVGFLAGAVGYFLAQTKEGKEIREKFADHWNELRDSLVAEGKLSKDEKDIPDYIRALRGKISEFLGELGGEVDSQKKTAKKKTVKRKKKLFQGI